MENFNLKKFLVENKLTANSKMLNEETELPELGQQFLYKFKNGEIVDAAIFFKDKIIPVDAKFSLEK